MGADSCVGLMGCNKMSRCTVWGGGREGGGGRGGRGFKEKCHVLLFFFFGVRGVRT